MPQLRVTRPGTDPVVRAIAAVARGEIVVVVDDEDRENQGDLIMAADAVTPEKVAFMVRHTSGVICVALDGARCDRLDLPLMVPPGANQEAKGTAFTVSVDLREGTTTGISSADRAATVYALTDPDRRAADFNRPGHVFPLRARPGGVLERPGHTEASVDLARLAGRAPAGVLCEVVLDTGAMARLPDLTAFARRHGLTLVTIRDLIAHRRRTEKLVARIGESRLPTQFGDFRCLAYDSRLDGHTHLAFVRGDPGDAPGVLVRVHRECLVGDVFGSRSCDCRAQLGESLRRVAGSGAGVILYLRGPEGRGSGLGEPGDDGCRDQGVAAQILADLGVATVRLLADELDDLPDLGVPVVEQVPLLAPAPAAACPS